ncbi:hypothetical protein [Streptomyces sp. NPDC049813]|uniref:hypothetical protein n=1 Tax=Streptomyces sp. NPDC049813 TaxID=3365597 RepID=UPI0037AF6492
MTSRTALVAFGVSSTAAVLATGLAGAPQASAGGIGDFLSPAFGTSCANLDNGARAQGSTSHGTGSAGGNLLGLPVGSALNQCGGADLLPAPEKPLEDVTTPVIAQLYSSGKAATTTMPGEMLSEEL